MMTEFSGDAPTPFQSQGSELIDVYHYSLSAFMACYREILTFTLVNKWEYFISLFFRISKSSDRRKLYSRRTRMFNPVTGVHSPLLPSLYHNGPQIYAMSGHGL